MRYDRKFIQMSYKCFGSGPESRNAQFIVHQCISILYALRCAFLVHCLDRVDDRAVDVPQQLSSRFLNSEVNSNFTSLQNIKRPGKKCIPDHFGQNVTWTCSMYTALQVHNGPNGLGRVIVSHSILKNTFDKILEEIVRILHGLDVPIFERQEFEQLQDSLHCLTAGHGLITFNPSQWANAVIATTHCVNLQRNFVETASKLYRLSIAAIHLSGGPSPRGTEEAVTRLSNSGTELMRNVYLVDGTIGVRSG
jgi:hypothetical protein